MKSPAFQFYPGDYLSSQRVQMMTLEEEGGYIRLLASCWQHGSIPSDPEKVARIIGKGASTTLATTLLTMFQPSLEVGRMTHDRLEKERLKQAIWAAKSSEGGKKSAEMRKNGKGGGKGRSRVVQPQGQPNSNSSSTSSLKDVDKSRGSLEEIKAFCISKGLHSSDGEWFYHKCVGSGWKNGGEPIISWKGTVASWKVAKIFPSQKDGQGQLFGNQSQPKKLDYSQMTEKEIVRACQ